MAITLTGIVTKKILSYEMGATTPSGIIVTISLSAGTDITESIPLDQESNFPMGATITLSQT